LGISAGRWTGIAVCRHKYYLFFTYLSKPIKFDTIRIKKKDRDEYEK